MASRLLFCLASFPLLSVCSIHATADTLTITSTPSGAKVEIDGVAEGTTPFEKNFPGGYFHRPRTALSARLEHPMVARLTLEGYVTKEIKMTAGPMNWIWLNGRNRGEYWLLKSDHFHVELESIAETFTGAVVANAPGRDAGAPPELSLEELVRQTKPAVVYLKGLDKAGSGFFVTGTGVIVTNAHLARGEESLLTVLSTGQQLEAKVVYVDADLDIALAKIDAAAEQNEFPHLALTSANGVRQGESVLAIGNPGDAMLFSVTKGIVSAVGKSPNAGPGTWVQTDAPINPGNSGGPLLNSRGEVIGINTQKLIKKNVTGIGFALSSTDVSRSPPPVLSGSSRVPPANYSAAGPGRNAGKFQPCRAFEQFPPPIPDGVGTVTITWEPDGAEIFVDDKFYGNTSATLKLPAGTHAIVLKFPGRADWRRTLEVRSSSRAKCR